MIAALFFTVGGSAARMSPPAITSVTFTGSTAKPTITIRGSRLGKRPHPNPDYHPLGHPPLCPPQPTKPLKAYGLDYGTSLFVVDRTQQPSWSAGRYRPQVNELDCIGLIVVKFTPSTVVLRFGAFYSEGTYRLAVNDALSMTVNGASFRARVRYG